jgi:hypothetical protein
MNTQTLVMDPALSTPEKPILPECMCHECFSPVKVNPTVAGKTGDCYIMKYSCDECGAMWLVQRER